VESAQDTDECDVSILRSCGFFLQPSWRAMCAALDVEDEQEEENQMLCSIDRIGKGEFDFVVPQVKRVRSGRPRVGCDDEERHAAGRWRD